MAEREFYVGGGLQAIDGKSRVAVAVDLRRQLERNGATKEIFLDVHQHGECLIGFDPGWLSLQHDEMTTEHRRLRDRGEASDLAQARRQFAPVGEPVSVDGSGRFVFPSFLKAEASLTKWAYFWGSFDYFEIWNPFALLASDRVEERLKRRVRHDIAEKGATA